MSLPDFVNQSSVDLTNRVSGFFGNEVKHDSLITSIDDIYKDVKALHDNVVIMEGEVDKDAHQVASDTIEVRELSDRVFQSDRDAQLARDEAVAAKERALVAETSATRSANSAASDAGKAKLSEDLSMNYAHDARGFANNALISEEESKKYFDYSYAIYEDLRKGQVYRGTWNPHTGAYPDGEGANSSWDVILNEGESEYTWDGKKWFWGDRLVYIKDSNTYQQIESGTGGGVTSVNGKKGAVILNAEEVGAVPIDGHLPMTGALNTKGVTINNDDARIFNSEGESFAQSTKAFGATLFGTGTKNAYIVTKDNLHVRKGGTDYKIYHEGYKPMASDVGAVPLIGNVIMTGKLTNTQTIYTHKDLKADGGLNVAGHGVIDGSLTVGGSLVGKDLSLTGTGNLIATKGGFVRSNTDSVMSVDGKVYSFVTSPKDAHLCSNSYWDGANWQKYNAAEASAYLVMNTEGALTMRTSSATSTNPNELTPMRVDKTGNASFLGGINAQRDIITPGSLDAGYMQVRNNGNPSLELHHPGNSAVMMYKPQNKNVVRFCQSNGAGGEAHGYGEVSQYGFETVNGRYASTYISSDRAWTGIGQNHFHGYPSNVGGNGTLYGLVGKQVNYSGHWGLENYYGVWVGSTIADQVSHTFVSTDGGGYTKSWHLYNGGAIVAPDGSDGKAMTLSGNGLSGTMSNTIDWWRLTGSGNLEGSSYGGYGNIVSWAVASFAPASDERLKRNIKPATKSALEDVDKIKFYSYDWVEHPITKEKKSAHIGVLAQELEEIDECYVRNITAGVEKEVDVKALDVTNTLTLALKAIQELSEANKALAERVATLEATKLV